jgi:hypothetical protein
MTSEPLSKFLTLYPKANDKVTQQLSKDFQNISDQDFCNAKKRIGLFKDLVPLLDKKRLGLDKETRLQILEAVLAGEVEKAKANVKVNNGVGSRSNNARPSLNPTTWAPGIRSVWSKTFSGENDVEGVVDDLIRRATEAATQISDSQFLNELEQYVEQYAGRFPQFQVLAEQARLKAFEHLEVIIMRTVKKLKPALHRIQEEDCTERIKRESAKRAEEELDKLRINLIKHVNDLSTRTVYSCVSSSFLLGDRHPRLTFVDIRCP